MKVLIFTSQLYEIGGIERLAIELVIDLNKHGIHADLLSMYSESQPNLEKREELLAMGVPNVYFLGLKVHPSPVDIIKGAYRLNRLVKKNNYDIVETSALTPIVITSFALRMTKCRQIAGIHQVFLSNRDNLFQHKILRKSLSLNDKVRYYGISNYASEKWISYSKISTNHIRCVYNSIPDDCFTSKTDKYYLHKKYGLPDNSKVIIYVGRVIKPKRPDLIIEALSGMCVDQNLAILFVGRIDCSVDGTEDMVKRMEQTIYDNNLNDRIKFIGSSCEVPIIMSSATLMVHPTQIEAFGLVLVEAMASGLQIVTTNVEGIPEVLEETDNIMVEPDDAFVLKNAIFKTLSRSEDEKSVAVSKGKNRAGSFRTKERTKGLIKLFNDVISNDF